LQLPESLAQAIHLAREICRRAGVKGAFRDDPFLGNPGIAAVGGKEHSGNDAAGYYRLKPDEKTVPGERLGFPPDQANARDSGKVSMAFLRPMIPRKKTGQ